MFRTLSSTYLSYSTAGTELLVNTGGEHVYLYQKFRKQNLKLSRGLNSTFK